MKNEIYEYPEITGKIVNNVGPGWMMLERFTREYDQRFHLEEILTMGMAIFLNVLIVTFSDIRLAPHIFLLNSGIVALVLLVNYMNRTINNTTYSTFRDWYVAILLLIIYMEHNTLVPLINATDIDSIIIKIDRILFLGNDPTILLERFTHPVITEILQAVYVSFYFLPFLLVLLLYMKGRKIDFHILASTILLGFFISYIGYYIFPAIGPRFTLDHLQAVPLTGIFTFDFFRGFIFKAGGITRDCFPSGHTLISALTVMLSYKYYRRFAPLSFIWGTLLIISTVYLRYHYVADLVAGFIIAVVVYRYGPTLARFYIFGSEYYAEQPAGENLRSTWWRM
ncbi:MAG TPA: phosphatase PAP2 family protein [Spirochaetota bacterium]|nr:phosphatase PAP2 family protein [Spirochaetota bacterium]